MKLIKLTRGQFAMVDDEDYHWLKGFVWRTAIQHKRGTYTARTRVSAAKGENTLLMHRMIMQPGPGLVVDHIDQNPLNNQKANLRICTVGENCRNAPKTVRKTKSKYKGVALSPWPPRPWVARIALNGKRIFLGYHLTEEIAARAYDAAAIKYYGEFACLNFGRVLQGNTVQEKTA